MQILSHQQTLDLLPYAAVAQSLQEMFQQLQRGEIVSPVRSALGLPGGTLLYMPASDGKTLAIKLVTVHPDNKALGAVQADVLVMNAQTGERVALLDGEAVTARRTAALSALAAQQLAAQPHGPLLLLGAGRQAQAHLEAFHALLGTSQALVYSRSEPSALLSLAQKLGVSVQRVTDLPAALSQAPLVVTATTATAPLFADVNLHPQGFFAAVGGFKADMQELPPELVSRARVVVDTLPGCQQEAGDLLRAQVDWSAVQDISLLSAEQRQPDLTRPTIFKSVGQAAWDLAAARLCLLS